MIRKFPYKERVPMFVECDSIKLPFWNVTMDYNDNSSVPFLFGKDKNGKGFVLVGKKGGAHNELICDNKKLLKHISMNRYDYLLGRIWFIYSLVEGAPLGLITIWDGECPSGYSSSNSFNEIKNLLREKKIDISEFEIITEYNYDIYSISVDEYISLNLQNTIKIHTEYERQEKIAQKGSSDKYNAFDYKGNGVGRLGYHLTAYMDENNKNKNNTKMDKKIINEKKLSQLVYECTMAYINSTPELKKMLQERREKKRKELLESKKRQIGVTNEMLFEMVKKTVKSLLK